MAMIDGFVRKKVESLTLGEKLRKLRQQYRMSYTEIAKATRIQARYLEYLEQGEYDKLPAEVYVRGFLKSYARHLGLEDEAFLKLYDKEKHIRENLGREHHQPESIRYPTLHTWIITPRTVLVVILTLVLGGTSFYLFTEFRSFVAEPQLRILDPIQGATIEGSTVLLRGQTDPGVTVTANGEPIFIGGAGEFTEELTLQQGLNRIVVRATNRFNKTKEETVVIESRVAVPNLGNQPTDNQTDTFVFRIRSIGQAATVTVVSGETVLYSGTLVPGREERFPNLTEPVRLTTSDALRTEVGLDDQPFESVGTEAVPIQGKMYSPHQMSAPPASVNRANP